MDFPTRAGTSATTSSRAPLPPPRQELLELVLERPLDHPAPPRIALGHREGELLRLLEGDVRRQRRHLRVGEDVDDARPVGGERLVPRRAELLRRLDTQPLET